MLPLVIKKSSILRCHPENPLWAPGRRKILANEDVETGRENVEVERVSKVDTKVRVGYLAHWVRSEPVLVLPGFADVIRIHGS